MFERVTRALVALSALYYSVVGVLLFAMPRFFYLHVGTIGAYNPHYERDAASFIFPLGIALFFATAHPVRYRPVLAIAAAASALHTVSHLLSETPFGEIAFFTAVTAVLGLAPLLGSPAAQGAERA
jgi:hypothetical protein